MRPDPAPPNFVAREVVRRVGGSDARQFKTAFPRDALYGFRPHTLIVFCTLFACGFSTLFASGFGVYSLRRSA